jgi:glutamine synthetase
LRVHLDTRAAAAIPALEKSLGINVLSRGAAKGGGEFSLLCPRGNLMSAVARLREAGCNGAITAEDVEYVFVDGNPIYGALAAQLKR